MLSRTWEKLHPHWPFFLAAVFGLALILANLGKDYLWADEGDTAVLAANIVKYGIPKAWDGVTFVDSDKGARLNHDLVMVTSPWLQYYLTAASFSALGENTFSARLIVSIAQHRALVWVPLLLIFALTNLAQITPWVLWADKNPNPENKIVAVHVPQRIIDGLFAAGPLLFIRDFFRSNPGTLAASCEFFRKNAKPSDVVITNYESEPLYFHTRLPQGMKIMKQDSIYQIAQRQRLPDYVFGVERAGWVIWRFNWDDYLGIRWADVEHRLLSEGAQIREAAQIEETAWENRENIHFHRFAGHRYLFPQDKDLAPARIFRIDWPAGP